VEGQKTCTSPRAAPSRAARGSVRSPPDSGRCCPATPRRRTIDAHTQKLAQSGASVESAGTRTGPPSVTRTTTHGGRDRRAVVEATRRTRSLEETATGKGLISLRGRAPACLPAKRLPRSWPYPRAEVAKPRAARLARLQKHATIETRAPGNTGENRSVGVTAWNGTFFLLQTRFRPRCQ